MIQGLEVLKNVSNKIIAQRNLENSGKV